MTRFLCCFLAVSPLLTTASADTPGTQISKYEWVSPEYHSRDYPVVRLLSLLVDGRPLVASKATVSGVLSTGPGEIRLYLTKEALEYSDITNSVAIGLTSMQVDAVKALRGNYVLISGTVVDDPSALVAGSVRIEKVVRATLGGPVVPQR